MTASVGANVCPEIEEPGLESVEIVALWEDEVVDVRYLAPPPAPSVYTVGSDPRADLVVPAPGGLAGPTPLVRLTWAGAEILLGPGMSAEVEPAGGPPRALAGGGSFALGAGARARVEVGPVQLLLRWAARPRRQPIPLFGRVSAREVAFLGGSALLHTLWILSLLAIPPGGRALAFDPADASGRRLATILFRPPVPAAEPARGALRGGEGVPRAPGPAGRAGRPGATGHGRMAVQGPRENPDPALPTPRALAAELGRHAGIVDLLGRRDGSTVGSIFGRESAFGRDPPDSVDAWGGLAPGPIGESAGEWGAAPAGPGRGGGCTHDCDAVLPFGRYDTMGKGGAPLPGSWRAGIAGALKGRQAAGPVAGIGPPVVRGRLDREIVRRVVRQHLPEVRFCYEREAIGHPDLAGRVQVEFTIGPNGRVLASGVAASSTRSPALDGCIQQAVRRWEFPQPEGGGPVIVIYPFLLRMAGG